MKIGRSKMERGNQEKLAALEVVAPIGQNAESRDRWRRDERHAGLLPPKTGASEIQRAHKVLSSRNPSR
jgi:hypothetical protein